MKDHMTWVRHGGCAPVPSYHTGRCVFMEYIQNFWNKHVKLDAVFALGTKKEGSRGWGMYLLWWLLYCLFLTETQFRENLEGFILFTFSVFLSIMKERASGAGQSSPSIHEAGSWASWFSSLIPAMSQSIEWEEGFLHKLIFSGNISRDTLRCGLCSSPKYFKSMQDDLEDK